MKIEASFRATKSINAFGTRAPTLRMARRAMLPAVTTEAMVSSTGREVLGGAVSCHTPRMSGVSGRERLRSIESAAIAGVVYAALTIVALFLLRLPADLRLSDATLTTWFEDAGNRATLIVGLNLVSIASVAFLWFVAVIRRRIGDHEDRFFSTVFLGSAVLYVATYITGTVALAAPALAFSVVDNASVDQASATFAIGSATGLLLVVGPRMQAVFMFTTSTLVLRAPVLPNWLAFLGYAGGALLFLFPLVFEPVGVGFPVWVLIASVTIALTRPDHATG